MVLPGVAPGALAPQLFPGVQRQASGGKTSVTTPIAATGNGAATPVTSSQGTNNMSGLVVQDPGATGKSAANNSLAASRGGTTTSSGWTKAAADIKAITGTNIKAAAGARGSVQEKGGKPSAAVRDSTPDILRDRATQSMQTLQSHIASQQISTQLRSSSVLRRGSEGGRQSAQLSAGTLKESPVLQSRLNPAAIIPDVSGRNLFQRDLYASVAAKQKEANADGMLNQAVGEAPGGDASRSSSTVSKNMKTTACSSTAGAGSVMSPGRLSTRRSSAMTSPGLAVLMPPSRVSVEGLDWSSPRDVLSSPRRSSESNNGKILSQVPGVDPVELRTDGFNLQQGQGADSDASGSSLRKSFGARKSGRRSKVNHAERVSTFFQQGASSKTTEQTDGGAAGGGAGAKEQEQADPDDGTRRLKREITAAAVDTSAAALSGGDSSPGSTTDVLKSTASRKSTDTHTGAKVSPGVDIDPTPQEDYSVAADLKVMQTEV
eukprot:GSA25T00016019001.1